VVAVSLRLPVTLVVIVLLGVIVPAAVPLWLAEPVMLLVKVCVAVEEDVCVGVGDRLEEKLDDPVPLFDPVGEPVLLTVALAVTVTELLTLMLRDGVNVDERVPLSLPVPVILFVFETVEVSEKVALAEEEMVPVKEPV
jgi:hypothetical protein